jgi:3',5'-cyclic-AMP phosphodiesterase
MTTTRRFFLRAFAASALPLPLQAAPSAKPLRIGLIADIHKDVIHDADERLRAFVAATKKQNADALLQLGDFCIPKPANQGFLEIFNSFNGPRFHVIGNHDTDGGYTREQTVAFWGMKSRYYSFDLGGFHFIVLDSNDKPKDWKGGYPSFIEAKQVDWLREDLAATSLNTFVFSHQSLERPACIDNQKEVRAILEGAVDENGKRKVAACFNGHWHLDHHRVINGIPYIHINSASYYWVGGKYSQERLPPGLAKQFPWVKSTIPYTKPLFTTLYIDPAAGTFQLTPCKSAWMGPGPDEINYSSQSVERKWIQPHISALELDFS